MPSLSDFDIIEESGTGAVFISDPVTVLDIYWIAQDVLASYPHLIGMQSISVSYAHEENIVMYWSLDGN